MHLLQPAPKIVAILVFAVFAILIVSSCQPIYKTRLPRFADDVKAVIEPQALQKWAVETLNKTEESSLNIPLKDIPLGEVPLPIRNLRSDGSPLQYALRLTGASPKDTYISLFWGSGFAHWGIDVGSVSFERPDGNDFYIEWAPGIYFWHQTR